MTTVAILGNSNRNLGAVCAGDMALAGHAVRYAPFNPAPGELEVLKVRGGFDLQGDPEGYFCGRTGVGTLEAVCRTTKEALKGAEVVLIDVPMPELESRFSAMLSDLPRGVVVHVLSHGYWPAARLTPLLRRAGREDVLVTEAVAPTHIATRDGIVVRGTRRRGLEISTVPGRRTDEALTKLRPLFSDLSSAPSVLQTGLESLNLMVHPAMTLLGIGLLERAELNGLDKIRFYGECNVPSSGRLADELDAERGRVCSAYGVRHRVLAEALDQYYGTSGQGAYEAVQNCAAYKSLAYSVSMWRSWQPVDVPYGIVPVVRLAEQAGIAAPLHRATAEIFGALLGFSPWSTSPTLESMALDGEPEAVIRRVS